MTSSGKRLSTEDWTDAALQALATGGLTAVAVEPLAKRLGTTKGSFYWHFKDRDALIKAAMRRWEEVGTEHVIADAESEPDPPRRIRKLFDDVIDYGAAGRVELSLMASIDHPAVAPTLARVSRRRVEYVGELLRTIGIPPAEARRRAIIAVSVYHGFNQLAHSVPEELPGDSSERRTLVVSVVDGLLAGYA